MINFSCVGDRSYPQKPFQYDSSVPTNKQIDIYSLLYHNQLITMKPGHPYAANSSYNQYSQPGGQRLQQCSNILGSAIPSYLWKGKTFNISIWRTLLFWGFHLSTYSSTETSKQAPPQTPFLKKNKKGGWLWCSISTMGKNTFLIRSLIYLSFFYYKAVSVDETKASSSQKKELQKQPKIFYFLFIKR